MHLLNAESVTVTHAGRALLDAVSLGIDDGDRVGVVGRNGAGKSTLLRILTKLQEPDGGRVTHARGLRLGMLAQRDLLDGDLTVRQAVVGDVPDHTWAADAAVRDVVEGLLGGLDAAGVGGLDARLGHLSGGQLRRVGLARLLAVEHDLVVLDEPTNHLDVEGVAWLAGHLVRRWPAGRGGLLVVTHDRWFLDAVCENTWEVHDGQVEAYEGGYAAYVLARAERARISSVTKERQDNLMRKELAWLRRGAPARTSKPKFRIEAANALIDREPPVRDTVALQRMATTRLGKDVIDAEGITLTVGTGTDREQTLLEDVTWRIGPGDRIGIVGVNGSGKTTLMRALLGDVKPSKGRVKRGKTVSSAVLSQDLFELDEVADLRVGEAVEKVRGVVRIGDRDVTATQLLERLGMGSDKVRVLVSGLSGGERRRVQLLRLMMAEPNVLVLDEPTNDLDTDTLAAVEDLLDGWPGTLLVVSHDRYLLERVADRHVALLGDGRLRDLPGGVEEYLALRAAAKASHRAAPAAGTPFTPETAGGASAADVRAARKEMSRIERRIAKLDEQEKGLLASMAEAATDHERIQALDAELRETKAERDTLEDEWMAAAELAD